MCYVKDILKLHMLKPFEVGIQYINGGNTKYINSEKTIRTVIFTDKNCLFPVVRKYSICLFCDLAKIKIIIVILELQFCLIYLTCFHTNYSMPCSNQIKIFCKVNMCYSVKKN